MKGRTLGGALVVSVSVLLLTGMVGCARKAVESPPAPASPSTARDPAETPPTPPSDSPTEASEALVPVFYAYDAYSLDTAARAALDRNARTLRDHPDLRITIEGHCDERGSVEYNQALGERRARAASDHLVASGVASGRIEVISYGKERPFDHGHDESAWANNRRAHFVGQ